jgi:hypothetical protein
VGSEEYEEHEERKKMRNSPLVMGLEADHKIDLSS